jgi:predicted NBD/HSP70 family sugar kinase
VYIYAGRGIGSGIVINKKLHRGAASFAGELGFMAPLKGENPKQNYTLDGGYLEWELNPLIEKGGKYGGGHQSGHKDDYPPGHHAGHHTGNQFGHQAGHHSEDDKTVLINFFTAIAANYNAIINPDAIVFGGEAFDKLLVEEIKMQLPYYSPKRSIPQVLHDSNLTMGADGLVQACMGNINPMMQLVQNGGV